jgi:hypothetical protein
MRVVGSNRGHSEFELDPARAFRRGRSLDRMLREALPAPERGVFRGTAERFARMDEARMREAARRINGT